MDNVAAVGSVLCDVVERALVSDACFGEVLGRVGGLFSLITSLTLGCG